MKQAIKDVTAWVEGIERAAKAQTSPHRRAILENYLQHVALEFNGRWPEFLGPDMTIEHPLYLVKLDARPGGGDVVECDGYKAVLDFYMALNEDTVLTNQDERLAVDDWGFAAYNTINQWTRGRHLAELGIEIEDCDPEGYYRVSRPIAMFWNYTPDAKLIGEEVYECGPVKVENVGKDAWPTWEEVRNVVLKYLPPEPLRKAAA